MFIYLYLIAVILFGGFLIGPFSIRVYMVLVMMVVLLFSRYSKGSRNPLPKNYIYWYIAFIVLMALAFMITGEFFEYGFIKFVLANHLVCIVTYFAIGSFVTNSKKIKAVTNVLLAIMFVSSVITILQYYNNPFGWRMARILSISSMNENLEEKIMSAADDETMLGHSYAMGIFDFAFSNAMYIAATAVLALYWGLNKNEPFVKRLLYLSIFSVGVVACFDTQQRAAFFSLIVLSVFLFWKSVHNRFVRVVMACLVLVLVVYFNQQNGLSNGDDVGRMTIGEFEEDSRYEMWIRAIPFIIENPFGGALSFMRINNDMPVHNFFLNAFIYGGWLGGLVVIALFIKMIIQIIKVIKTTNASSSLSLYYAIGLLIYFICGMVHNSSLVFGSVLIFILFPLMLCERYFEQID